MVALSFAFEANFYREIIKGKGKKNTFVSALAAVPFFCTPPVRLAAVTAREPLVAVRFAPPPATDFLPVVVVRFAPPAVGRFAIANFFALVALLIPPLAEDESGDFFFVVVIIVFVFVLVTAAAGVVLRTVDLLRALIPDFPEAIDALRTLALALTDRADLPDTTDAERCFVNCPCAILKLSIVKVRVLFRQVINLIGLIYLDRI